MKVKINKFSGVTFGVLFGLLAGIALKDIGLWICLGLAIGAAVDYTRNKNQNSEGENEK